MRKFGKELKQDDNGCIITEVDACIPNQIARQAREKNYIKFRSNLFKMILEEAELGRMEVIVSDNDLRNKDSLIKELNNLGYKLEVNNLLGYTSISWEEVDG